MSYSTDASISRRAESRRSVHRTRRQSARFLVADLAGVSFLASLGVRTLMISAKTINRRGDYFAVCSANENVEKVLRSTGFDEIVGLYPDFTTAAAALKKEAASFESKSA